MRKKVGVQALIYIPKVPFKSVEFDVSVLPHFH